ncbi:MAG: heme o synthase [Alphaproteobacteria bacterium]|nr:protoheme IX farnesyltransferase [Alphaproteobacteria bacterium]MCB1551053.1 heme o synthase [Alphaproteobacteria bacterium]MCB9985501.1 protoheme IX farnesyltransferase [Micavibrio sp.]HPQ50191.1 heme o synthase [Alphaproteobacteria bacterium]
MSQVVTENTLQVGSSAGDFFSLLKPRVMSLVVFSGFAGYWIAPGRADFHPLLAFMGILALAIGAGASGAFNMWYDRDIDAVMNRTKNRAVPLGRIAPDDALGFAVIMSILAVMMMGLATNWVAAGLLGFASFFYVVIYTMWLKRRTAQNIVIGGAAGAFPPMIGWAMVTGHVSIESILLFSIIFFWTPPHFWALALFANSDYTRAKIPMLPVVSGARVTKWQMLVYTLILLPLTIVPVYLGMASWIYGGVAALLSGFFVLSAILVLGSDDLKFAKRMFGFSVFYLFALFLALMLCHN